MNAYIFVTQAGAVACVSPVDTAQGYPSAGIEIGGGVHVKDPVTGGPFRTLTYFQVLKHPTLTEWAYIADGVSNPVLTPLTVQLSLPVAVTLDSTWNGALPVMVAVGP